MGPKMLFPFFPPVYWRAFVHLLRFSQRFCLSSPPVEFFESVPREGRIPCRFLLVSSFFSNFLFSGTRGCILRHQFFVAFPRGLCHKGPILSCSSLWTEAAPSGRHFNSHVHGFFPGPSCRFFTHKREGCASPHLVGEFSKFRLLSISTNSRSFSNKIRPV